MKILAVGDSNTSGWTGATSDTWRGTFTTIVDTFGIDYEMVGRWEAREAHSYVTSGWQQNYFARNGWRTANAAGFIEEEVGDFEPDYVLVMLGINGMSDNPLTEFDGMVDLIANARAAKADIVFLIADLFRATTSSGNQANQDTYNALIRDLPATHGTETSPIHVVDCFSVIDRAEHTADDLHLNADGEEIIGVQFAAVFGEVHGLWADPVEFTGILSPTHTDTTVTPGTTYRYRVAVADDGAPVTAFTDWVEASTLAHPEGTASGVYGWAGVASGVHDPAGQATGAYEWVGAAEGTVEPAGTADGTYGWSGSALGTAPEVGEASGSASGSWSFTGAAAGAHEATGDASGTYGWVGAATGAIEPAGTATGSYGWTGAAGGTAPTVGESSGTVTGSWAYVGAATGTADHAGTGTGTWSFTGAAAGFAPVVGAASGTATGSYGFTGEAAGQTDTAGVATGAYTWTGTATGTAPEVGEHSGTATGTYGWAGTASGSIDASGTAAGAYSWVGAATELVIVAPPERTLIVRAEDRTYTVEAESRTLSVPHEDRTLEVTR